MSEIAGRMSIQEGTKYLEKPMMGHGILLGGVPGVAPANVLVLGGGVVGTNAARMAAGLAANVTLMDIDLGRLRYLDEVMPGSVIVDVSIDQGGCAETSRPTTHSDLIYLVDGVVHYCVTNIPGAMSRTSTLALGNATRPYIRQLASMGVPAFARLDAGRAAAINMVDRKLSNEAVATAFPNLRSLGEQLRQVLGATES